MSFYAFSALFNLLTSLIFGAIVFFRNPKSIINQSFLFFTLTMSFWSFGYYMWQISTQESQALFWTRVLMAGAIFIPVTSLTFIYSLVGKIYKKKYILIVSYLLFFIFLLFDFTSLFVNRVEPILGFQYWPRPGIIYHPFLLIWGLYVIYIVYILYYEYRRTKGVLKVQLKYILIGMAITFSSGSTNYFLWYRIPILPVGNILASFYVATVAYAVLKHHLFNVKIIAFELLIGSMGATLVFLVFASTGISNLVMNMSILGVFIIFSSLLIKEMLVGVEREEHLNKANHDLRNLIQTKDNFLRMTSHQLRTPLTVVNGYLSMLTDTQDVRYKMNKEARDDAMKTYLSSQALLGIVNDLLSANAINSGRFGLNIVGPVNVKEMIQDILDNKKQLFDEYKTDVKFTTQGQDFIGHIDNPKVRETLNNLIDNAVFYGHGKVFVTLYDNNETIMITIKDNGVGVTAEDAKKLWKKFVRGKDSPTVHPNGSGLGLYLARKIVRLHKGTIELHSDGKDKGTEFKISLPKKKTVNLNRNV